MAADDVEQTERRTVMALKVLMLRKKLDEANKQMAALRKTEEGFTKREEELATAIEEASTEEEQKTVEDAVAEFEADKERNSEEIGKLADTIAQIEADIATEEARQDTTPAPQNERKEETTMIFRSFAKMTDAERTAFVQREDVHAFLTDVRDAMSQKRALTNVGLTIPQVMLGLLRENIENYSKLYKHINVRAIPGDGRMIIMGTIPEAVWTEACATLNELDLSFFDTEVDCYKVGGFFAVCNATLEDSDLNLASELLTALGQAIGFALDKAILYGTGTKMPLGVVTRLVQTEQPTGYPATARPWVDLHTTNVLTIPSTTKAKDLFAQIVRDSGAMKGKYSRGGKVWVMNETTYTTLIAEAMSIDAGGAIVSGVNGQMPVVGGAIEVLNFLPDNVIIAGYFDLYLLAERAGQKFATSEHVRFIQDQTVFKGTARYDGKPVIAEGFVAIGINGVTPNATMTFAADTANA